MDKEKARELLQQHIDRKTEVNGRFVMPIKDEVVARVRAENGNEDQCYTWKYLINLVYG